MPPRLTFFPPGLKTPCQPLLGFLNGLVDYKCCQPTIVCSAILSAIVFKFFCMFSILLAGLVFFFFFFFFLLILSKLCLSSVSAICIYFYVLYNFDVLCLTPGPNWKTVFTLSFVTQAKEVVINKMIINNLMIENYSRTLYLKRNIQSTRQSNS